MSFLCVLRGPQRTEDDDTYACICCGWTSKNLDAFSGPHCWPCGVGENLDCALCVERGAAFNRFRIGRKLHRIRAPMMDATEAVAVCGYRVARAEVGQATAVIHRYCRHCWPDGERQS